MKEEEMEMESDEYMNRKRQSRSQYGGNHMNYSSPSDHDMEMVTEIRKISYIFLTFFRMKSGTKTPSSINTSLGCKYL